MTDYPEARSGPPIESSIPAGAVPLESILFTEELHRRPSRPPDHEKENRALVKLVSALADSPGTTFQTLAETILHITQCDSAGLSLLTTDGRTPDVFGKKFYWPAIAGMWNPHVGGGTPRNFGPCGDVLDQNCTLLFKHFERRYPYLLPVIPAADECLLVPFYVADKAVGTIWAIMHSDRRKFDAEDDRIMGSLGKFASSAYQVLASNEELRFQIGEREKAEAALHKLYEAERQSRAEAELAVERTMRLQSLAAELVEALTPAEVAEVVVRHGIASVGADAGALQLLSDDGKMLEVVNGQASDRSLIEGEFRRLSTELKLPSMDALHTGEPIFIESKKDLRDNYPQATDKYPPLLTTRVGLRARAGAHIPLILSGRPFGVLFLGFSRPRKFSESQRLFVLALARQCSQALGRTQLYEAELEGRGRLSRLVEGLHEGVVSVNRRGRVEFANSTAKHMLSPTRLEEGNHVPETWLGFPLRSFVAGLLGADEPVVEAQILSPDGEHVFEVTGILAARSDAVLVVFHDVSERERRARVEQEFVTNAAHELRTPLAAITSAIERLQAGAREIPERRDRFLGHIQHESARLNRLASSLLVLARAQTREEEPRREEIALHELLDELVDELELNRGVELVLDCSPDLVVRSNRDLLEHALLNLASNAARHTERGRVRVSARVDDGGSVIIEVHDTGNGIPADQLSRLFDRFYRGPAEERSAGFGLGLPITKEAVEAMNGRVEIDSVPGAGTTARIVLPRSDVPVPA